MKTETSSTYTPPSNNNMSRTNGTHDQGSAAFRAAGYVFLSCVLYIVFLLSYVCSPHPNDLLHHLKEKGLKSSTFCTVIHGFRDSVVTLLRNRVNFCRHLGYLAHRRKTFLASSLAYYPNSVAGFRLLSCGDISHNPVPAPNCNKNLRSVCRRSVAHITTERFNAMFASSGVTSNVVK